MKTLNEECDRPASDGFLPLKRLGILSSKDPDLWWTFQFPSVTVTSITCCVEDDYEMYLEL